MWKSCVPIPNRVLYAVFGNLVSRTRHQLLAPVSFHILWEMHDVLIAYRTKCRCCSLHLCQLPKWFFSFELIAQVIWLCCVNENSFQSPVYEKGFKMLNHAEKKTGWIDATSNIPIHKYVIIIANLNTTLRYNNVVFC